MASEGQITTYTVEPRVSAKVSKYVITPYTCTKIALASFAVGVFVGFRLNKAIRRLAARMLKKVRDGD